MYSRDGPRQPGADDQRHFDLRAAKTNAGRRTITVPTEIRPDVIAHLRDFAGDDAQRWPRSVYRDSTLARRAAELGVELPDGFAETLADRVNGRTAALA